MATPASRVKLAAGTGADRDKVRKSTPTTAIQCSTAGPEQDSVGLEKTGIQILILFPPSGL